MAHLTRTRVGVDGWFLWVLPPAWFAGLDDALAGSHAALSFDLAALAVVATGVVLWLAFGKLAADYGVGLQLMSEKGGGTRALSGGGRVLDWLVARPPLSWWLRRPVERASFLLCLAYLTRDRDCKLRVYPSVAPLLITPLGAFRQRSAGLDFVIAFVGALLAEAPMLVLHQMRVSQDWAAADVFHVVPLAGPAQLCSGARKATQALFAPLLIVVAGAVLWHDRGSPERLLLLLPGLIAMPVCSWFPCRNGLAVPLSQAPTGARQAARGGLSVTLLMLGIIALGAVSLLAWQSGWFRSFLIVELVVGTILVTVMKRQSQAVRWSPLE